MCEDSGFSSLTLDKSLDSSVDHDGSFQELLLSASTGNCATPYRSEVKWRSRLQRQHRLSTLKEGGSQSEEDIRNINQACKDSVLMDSNHEHHRQCHSHSKDDEVFDDSASPLRDISVSLCNSMTSVCLASAIQDNVTPLRTTKAKPENITPLSITPADQDITPLKTTPADLSLTPALQLVHAMCQQKAQIFVNQSPSMEEQLNSVTAWAKTRVTFRTTMPLAGLIGRKIGLGNVDVLNELKKRSLRHILALVISHLSSEDIYRWGFNGFTKHTTYEVLSSAILSFMLRLIINQHRSDSSGWWVKDSQRLEADLKVPVKLYRRSLLHLFMFDRFGQVCKSWNEIILQDKEASFRRRHQRKVVAAPEVGHPPLSVLLKAGAMCQMSLSIFGCYSTGFCCLSQWRLGCG